MILKLYNLANKVMFNTEVYSIIWDNAFWIFGSVNLKIQMIIQNVIIFKESNNQRARVFI